jgi:Ulp1 family protease
MCSLRHSRDARSWFFKSFFFTKLLNEGGYNYKNVKRWSKKVPGKDIFEVRMNENKVQPSESCHAKILNTNAPLPSSPPQLNCIFWPLNLNNMHWCCLKADMRNKVITYYDSFGR